MNASRWQVQILHPVTGKAKVWSTHDDRSAAVIEAGEVRRVGLFAQVRRADEQPEHNGERRKFLIWALMIGATSPAVVVERIIQDVEGRDA